MLDNIKSMIDQLTTNEKLELMRYMLEPRQYNQAHEDSTLMRLCEINESAAYNTREMRSVLEDLGWGSYADSGVILKTKYNSDMCSRGWVVDKVDACWLYHRRGDTVVCAMCVDINVVITTITRK